jgi:hypothetical protein
MLGVIMTMEGHSSRNWNTEYLQDMPGKFLNELHFHPGMV